MRNSDPQPDIEELMTSLRDWQLYVLQFRMTKATNDVEATLAPVLKEHLLWLLDLEKKGALLFSGPFIDETGYEKFDGSGQAIIRAPSLQAAIEIAESEPFAKASIRENTVVGWRVNEGQLRIKVNLLQNSFELE